MVLLILKDRKGTLRWNSANKRRYEDLGYQFTRFGDEFIVEIDDLTKTTRALVCVECDYCGRKFSTNFKEYNSNIEKSVTKKVACINTGCIQSKMKESSLAKYGKESANQVDEVKKKKEITYMSKYGVKNPSQSPIIKNKVKNSFKEHYGVDNIFMIITFSGESHHAWRGGVKPLVASMRNKLHKWREDSLKKHNYSCFITGKADVKLDIHHAYSFNQIFDETINSLNIDIRDGIGKYSDEELKLIEKEFIKIHSKYGLGYPIEESLHSEFHNIYGRKNNTTEQLMEFKNYILNNRNRQVLSLL